ncbi:hypothetical protein Sjap_014354 [Stephania japonica]|uniref:Uncharacterized protein n=1 Tax=Stephania japonica TaxID=461633 RepID=A0AAP0IZH5_9MAGN
MGHHHHHHHHHHEGDSPYDDPLLACCCCPCFIVSSIFRGIGRCVFVACYPLLQCFGLDDYRRHHHHLHHSLVYLTRPAIFFRVYVSEKMLQWMGGSRRKVTASRKSTQKRQRQYFQQKKRQQQTFGLDENDDGTNPSMQYQENPKSLDILSLLNLATVAHECNSGYIHENPKICSSPLDHQPLNARAKDLPSSTDIATTSSSHEVDKLPPKTILQRNPDDVASSCNPFDRNDNKLNNWKIETKDHLSSLVLFDDDDSNEHFGRNPARETHVAFSVQGLGKIGLETPVHSPLRPNRASSPGYSILNAAKRRHLSKMRDSREHQPNTMLHYVNEPLADCATELAFRLKSVREHSGKLRSSKPSSQGCMPVETHDYQMDNEFGKEWPCDDNVDSEEAWNEWDNSWYMDTSTNIFKTTRHDIYGSNFEDSYMKKRRWCCKSLLCNLYLGHFVLCC